MSTILKVENLSKQYRLGLVGTGTLKDDVNRFWHRVRGKEDPYLKIGSVNDRSAKATQDYVWALQDINFEVEEGEVLGIIGKNGAGKSTLLKILSRVTSPTTGIIKTKGRIASLLEVGTGFHPELTGKENIYLNGAILGMSKSEIRSKIDEIIAFSGCEMYIDTPVKRYSSGMRVRLAFAVAAHLEPDILVVDEVLAVGDAEFQKKAIGKMQDISQGEGRTVLFVSHNMGSVKSLCTRAILIDNGSITLEGEVDTVVSEYLSSNQSLVGIDLEKRTDRVGGELFRYTACDIFDDKENTTTELLSGETYTFKLSFWAKTKLDKLRFRIQFIDQNGIVRFLCNNRYSSDLLQVDPSKNQHIYCKIPEFPLPNGSYTLRLTCGDNTGFIDDLESAYNITVVGGDFYNTGKQQYSKSGVLVHHKIEVY